MKKYVILSIICAFLLGGASFAAKYKVNTSGTVKSPQGTTVAQPKTQSNPYSVYTPTSYNAQAQTSQVQYIDLVMDYSGSMSRWIEQAKRTMSSIIAQIPSSTKVGLRVFGQGVTGPNLAPQMGTVTGTKKVNGKIQVSAQTAVHPSAFSGDGCTATQKMVALTQASASSLIAGMNLAQIGGSTPMVYGMQRAVAEDFGGFDRSAPKKLILITDGGENCGGDPCKFAKDLMRQRSDIHIDVILVDSGSSRLSCLASTTGGHMYKVDDVSKFSTVLTQSMQAQPTTSTTTKTTTPKQQQYEYYKD